MNTDTRDREITMATPITRWLGASCMGLLTGLGTIALPGSAAAQHTIPPMTTLMTGCTTGLNSNSLPIHATVPRGRTTALVRPRTATGPSPSNCSELTWVKLRGTGTFSASIAWAGRVAQNGWDCNHSNLAWSLYKKASNGTWSRLGGGETYGSWSNNACVYNNSGVPGGSGTYSITDSAASGNTEYRVAFNAWSHNTTSLGHSGTDCADPENCSWPVTLTLSGVRPVALADFAYTTGLAGQNPKWWFSKDSVSGVVSSAAWGYGSDFAVPGDYDNDTNSDYAIWRPSDGNWWVTDSASNASRTQQWGMSGDTPAPADYDGDGKTDFAVTRVVHNGTAWVKRWFVIGSATGTWWSFDTSSTTATTVPADYDGDLRADYATWESSSGLWQVYSSWTGALLTSTSWGLSGDAPVPADYDGDGKADLAVWRPSDAKWYIINSSNGGGWWVQWGASGDTPLPGYSDTDLKTDFIVFRSSNNTWYSLRNGSWVSSSVAQSAGGKAIQFSRGE